MDALDALRGATGAWTGANRLHDPNTGTPEDTPATATITPILGGRFVRVDYSWSYQGQPQEGSYLIGHDPKAGTATAYWVDSWHMGRQGMACVGTADGGAIDVVGSYPAPPGPDWGWRTRIEPAESRLALTMWNLTPEGEAGIAVEAVFSRAL